jgi:hypothetical protein
VSLLQSHLLNLVVFSALVAAVFATLLRDEPRARVEFGLRAFAGFVVLTIVLGWIMRPFPG